MKPGNDEDLKNVQLNWGRGEIDKAASALSYCKHIEKFVLTDNARPMKIGNKEAETATDLIFLGSEIYRNDVCFLEGKLRMIER